MTTINNKVIKALTEEHGAEIINYFKSSGVNILGFLGFNEADGYKHIYYGVINGLFSFYTLKEVQEANAEIIELPSTNI